MHEFGWKVLKTHLKWLKMSKVVIAWKIWTKGQIEATKVKLNKVRNSNKAVSSIKQKLLLDILS